MDNPAVPWYDFKNSNATTDGEWIDERSPTMGRIHSVEEMVIWDDDD